MKQDMEQKDLGQHFLIDQNSIRFIIEQASLKEEDVVLEIGPGKGILTREICKKCQCIAVEIDKTFFENLTKEFKIQNIKTVSLINENILKVLDNLHFNKIVSNIPYSISEPLFNKLLNKGFELGIMTIGENFFEVLKGNTKPGILFGANFEIQKLRELKKTAFYPPPKVESCIIKIEKKKEKSEVDRILSELVHFDEKRIKNALNKIYEKKITKKGLKNEIILFKKIKNIDDNLFNKRIFQLSNTELILLVEFLRRLNQKN